MSETAAPVTAPAAPPQGPRQMDAFGATALIAMALLFAFNQVVIRVVNEGLQPIFFAGLRSLGAAICVWLWIRLRGRRLQLRRDCILPGMMVGTIFAGEFTCLFYALDYTTVSRSSVIFYSMPVWLSLAAHMLIPGDRLSPRKIAGLVLAMSGVAWALLHRDPGGGGLIGDLLSLAASWGWASVALATRVTPLRQLRPEMQHLWQLTVSAPILLALAPLGGPLIRELAPIHLWGLGFQIVGVAAAGFVFWFWLLSVYPPSGVASFSFLSPLFGILLGWLLLGEHVGAGTLGGGALVALGIALVNWPRRRTAAAPAGGPPRAGAG